MWHTGRSPLWRDNDVRQFCAPRKLGKGAVVVNGWWSSRFLSFLSSTDWRLAHWPSRKHKPCLMAWCTALGWRNPSSSQIHQAADGYMEEWKNSPSWLHWRGRSVFFFKDQQPKCNMVVVGSYICITLDQEGGQKLLCRFFTPLNFWYSIFHRRAYSAIVRTCLFEISFVLHWQLACLWHRVCTHCGDSECQRREKCCSNPIGPFPTNFVCWSFIGPLAKIFVCLLKVHW